MDHDDRLDQILGEQWERGGRGESVDAADLIAAHPDLADAIRARFAALELVGGAFGGSINGEHERAAAADDGHPALSRIGEYRVLHEIGRGGMGVVYAAEQESMQRRVALKVLYPSITNTAKTIERFQREARTPGRLQHTNIVTVYELGEDRGTWYCAMELVDGHSLDRVLTDLRRLRPPSARKRRKHSGETADSGADAWKATTGEERYFQRVAEMFAEVADGLQLAHDEGVVHRDVKPANLILAKSGRIKILDFGLARMREGGAALTVTGGIVGTPAYMSPEQARSQPADARSDVWSLGATLYEVLTLRLPFHAKDVAEILQKLRNQDARPPSRLDRRIPRDLETIVLKALEKDPARRYATSRDMSRDLRAFADGRAITARRLGVVARSWRVVKRNRLAAGLAAGVLVLAAVAAALLVQQRDKDARLRRARYAELMNRFLSDVRLGSTSFDRLGESRVRFGSKAVHCELLREASRAAPERYEPYHLLAMCADSVEECDGLLEQARARGMPRRLLHFTRAFQLRSFGRGSEVAAECATARASPDEPAGSSAWVEARLLLFDGRWSEAVECLTAASAYYKSPADRLANFQLYSLRASAREALGDFTGALEDLSRVRDGASPSEPYLDVCIASLWKRLGQKGASDSALARALAGARSDTTSQGWVCFFEACLQRQETSWIVDAGEEATRLHPNEFCIFGARARAELALGNEESARELAAECVRLEPGGATIHYDLAQMLANRARFADALEELGRAEKLERDPLLLALLGSLRAECLWHLGRREEGRALINAQVERCPTLLFVQARLASILMLDGRLEEALEAAGRAVQLDPSNEFPRELRLTILAWLGRWEDLERFADECLVRRPGMARAASLKAFRLCVRGELAEALAMADRAVQAGGRVRERRGEAYRIRGMVLAELHRYPEALDAFTEASVSDPADESAHVNRYVMMQRLNYPLSDTMQAARNGVRRVPTSAAWHLRLADCLLRAGQHAESCDAAKKALALSVQAAVPPWQAGSSFDPTEFDEAGARALLATSLALLGRYDEAVDEFKRSIRLTPGDAIRHYNLADILARLNRLDEAEQEFAAATKCDPSVEVFRHRRAQLLVDLRRHQDALASADEGIDRRPSAARWHEIRGWALQGLGRTRDACAAFQRALALADTGRREKEPGSVQLVYGLEWDDGELNVGMVYAKLGGLLCAAGDASSGIAAFERALVESPAGWAPRCEFAWFLSAGAVLESRDVQRAVKLAREALRLAPNNAAVRNTLGVALCQAGQWRDALHELDKSMAARGGGDPNDWFFVAIATKRLGDDVKAREWYDKAVAWLKERAAGDAELVRFQHEAAQVLGIETAPATAPK